MLLASEARLGSFDAMTSMTKFKPATPDRLQKSSGAHSATAGPHIERRTEAPSDVDAASDLSAITLALVVVSLLFQTYAPDPYMVSLILAKQRCERRKTASI